MKALTPLLLGTLIAFPSVAVAQQCGTTTRASVNAAGVQGNNDSVLSEFSGDGRFIFFNSTATNLIPGDTSGPGTVDIFRKDLQTGAVELVSQNSAGVGGNLASFSNLGASHDGRYVVFHSLATNFAGVDGNGTYDSFLRDMELGTTEVVSESTSGGTGNDESMHPHVSSDGRYVVFASRATDLGPVDANGNERDIFLKDRVTGTVTIVSVSSSGQQGNGESNDPEVSADGRFVVFSSWSTNLVPGDTNAKPDAFLRDLQTGETTLITQSFTGGPADRRTDNVVISPCGRFIALSSRATNLVPNDTNGKEDVFWMDRVTGELRLVSVSSAGVQADRWSSAPQISDDGRYVLFSCIADNLVPNDTNDLLDVFVHDVLTSTTVRASVNSNGDEAEGNPFNNGNGGWGISGDGRLVGITSWATNLAPGDTNEVQDVFVRAFWPEPERYCTATPSSTGAAARIEMTGNPSVTTGLFGLSTSPVPDQPGLFFFGSAMAQIPSGDGFQCVAGSVFRLPVENAASGVLSHAVDFGTAPGTNLLAGSTWNFQGWFRDPAAGGAGWNFSDAIAVELCP